MILPQVAEMAMVALAVELLVVLPHPLVDIQFRVEHKQQVMRLVWAEVVIRMVLGQVVVGMAEQYIVQN